MIRHWSHARKKGWGYPPKKTACQSGLRFQRYKPLKSVTTAGGPLILRFLVYISRNSLRASRSLVITALSIIFSHFHRRINYLLYKTCHKHNGSNYVQESGCARIDPKALENIPQKRPAVGPIPVTKIQVPYKPPSAYAWARHKSL